MSNDLISDEQIDENWQASKGKTVAPWRVKTSNWFFLVALGCFVVGPLMMAFLYWYAWQQGLYPKPNARPVTLGGPWSRNEELSYGVFLLLNPPIYAFTFAILSLILKPNKRAGVVLGSSLAFLFIAFSRIGLGVD